MEVEKRGLSAWAEAAACGLMDDAGLELVSVEHIPGQGAASKEIFLLK